MSRDHVPIRISAKLLLIMRRDQWQCQMPRCICPDGRIISKRLAGTNDPWAPSMDHIIPRSRGGITVPMNLRAAHRHCNKLRSDQMLGNEWQLVKLAA